MSSLKFLTRPWVAVCFSLGLALLLPFAGVGQDPAADEKCCGFGIYGMVFHDKNSDTIFNGTDSGLVGWLIEIVDASSSVVTGTTYTDGSGNWQIDVPIGCGVAAIVRCVAPSGWTQTFPTGSGEHTGTWFSCAGEQFGPYDFAYTDPPCEGVSVTYTTDPEFLLGDLSGVVTAGDQLELSPTGTTFDFAWIANTNEGTISKVNTNTGREVARYYTGPAASGGGSHAGLAPSRTAVDENGNCWVLNRAFGDTTSVTMILTTGGDDRNTNTIIETSFDANSNGIIELTEMLSWGADERVVRHYLVGNGPPDNVGRGLAIDKMGFLWVGLYNGQRVVKLDPALSTATYGPHMPPSHPPELTSVDLSPWAGTPYGLALSPNGNLYVATLSPFAFEIDPGLASGGSGAGPAVIQHIQHEGANYGIAVDRDCIVWLAKYFTGFPFPPGCVRWDPTVGVGNPLLGFSHALAGASGDGHGITVDFNGDIWMAVAASNEVTKYLPTDPPTWVANYASDVITPWGIGIASDGNVIPIGMSSFSWRKLDLGSGLPIPLVGPQLTGSGPYSYSDFTGSLQNIVSKQQGFWTVITDGGSNGLLWNLVGWNQATPPGTSVTVEYRVASSLATLSSLAWTTLTSSGPLTSPVPGRFIETRVRLIRDINCGDPFITPILYDLTVEAVCDPCFFISCQDVVVPCEDEQGAVVIYPMPSFPDSCEGHFELNCDPPSGSFFPIGMTPVLCTGVSAVGDSVTCEFTVTVTGDCFEVPTGACCIQGSDCTEVTEAHCHQMGGIYYGDGSDCSVGCRFPCSRVPRFISAWYPLNRSEGGFTANLADDFTAGQLFGDPIQVEGEFVTNCFSFDGTDDFIAAPDGQKLDLGSGNFTFDVWVKLATDVGFQPILDKRDDSTGLVLGYQLYVDNGYPGLQLVVNGEATNYQLNQANGGQAAFVADGLWHFIAVTVDRTDPHGLQFYVDGLAAGEAFNPTEPFGDLDNSAELWIGRSHPLFLPGTFFHGWIDEIEIFTEKLEADAIFKLMSAGSAGKCPEACYAPTRVQCCDAGVAQTAITICNYDNVPHIYSWGLSPLSSGFGCYGSGPTSFTPASGTLTIPAMNCVSIPVDIVCPTDIVGGQQSCYQISVFNHDTGRSFGCRGSVRKPSWWCLKWQHASGQEPAGIVNISTRMTAPLQFDLIIAHIAPLPVPTEFPFELHPVSDDESKPSSVISLDGLPPGEPVVGSIMIPQGEQPEETITVRISANEVEPLQFDKILVYADDDMDGTLEVIGELAVRTTDIEPTAVGSDQDLTPRQKRPFRTVPNPFNPMAQIAFEIEGSGPVPVSLQIYDLRGRLVKVIYKQQPLAPGLHEVTWQGDDAYGRKLPSGVYLMRLETPDYKETVKAMLVK